MANPFVQKSWSPYVVGSLIAVLSWFAFATADKPITLPEITHTSPWLWIAGLALTGLAGFVAERIVGHRPGRPPNRVPQGARA